MNWCIRAERRVESGNEDDARLAVLQFEIKAYLEAPAASTDLVVAALQQLRNARRAHES